MLLDNYASSNVQRSLFEIPPAEGLTDPAKINLLQNRRARRTRSRGPAKTSTLSALLVGDGGIDLTTGIA